MAFGGAMGTLLPPMSDIPEEFHGFNGTKWNKIFCEWFYAGLPGDTKFHPKNGIDPVMALRHVSSIMRSWAPKHEYKDAGCAYLLSLWFDDIVIPEKEKR